MSLGDAKRLLQWQVVTEALEAADVGAEVMAIVEHAHHVDDTAHGMVRMLLGGSDPAKPKNYVKVELTGMIPPFDRAYVELVRPGGRTSHELRELLRIRLEHVRRVLTDEQDRGLESLREAIIYGIDQDLAAEAP